MNKRLWLAALAICLALTACGGTPQQPSTPDSPPAPVTAPTSQQDYAPEEPVDSSTALSSLTVELVVDWESADQLLASLDQLSGLLGEALLEKGFAGEQISITLSTAGGFTAGALRDGGVDAAVLPAADYLACREKAAAVLTSSEDPCTSVMAVSTAREELGEAFQSALVGALADTEPGQQFLSLCYPGAVYIPATQEALQALDDWAAQLETSHGE